MYRCFTYRYCIFQCISLKLLEVIWRGSSSAACREVAFTRKMSFFYFCILYFLYTGIESCLRYFQQGFVNRMKLAVRSLCSLLCPPLLIKRTGVNC